MKKLLLLFLVLILISCDSSPLWNDMLLQVIHNKTGKKFTYKYQDSIIFTLDKNEVYENKSQYGRTNRQVPIGQVSGKYTFEFEDGKILETNTDQYPDLESIISKKNIISTKGGGVRIRETINYYITEEVYEKAK